MKLQAKLPGMHSNRTILQRTVARRLVKQGLADMLLSEFMSMPVDHLFGDVLQQFPQATAFLEGGTRNNPQNKLPSLVA